LHSYEKSADLNQDKVIFSTSELFQGLGGKKRRKKQAESIKHVLKAKKSELINFL
jgi:hypothetical protein